MSPNKKLFSEKKKISFFALRQIFFIFLFFISFLNSLKSFGFFTIFSQSDHTSTKARLRTFLFKPFTVVCTSGNSGIIYFLYYLYFFYFLLYLLFSLNFPALPLIGAFPIPCL